MTNRDDAPPDETRDVAGEAPVGEARGSGRLLDAVPHIAWLASPDGQVVGWNRAALEYFARPEQALLGDGWLTDVHPDDRASLDEVRRVAVRDGGGLIVEVRLRKGAGDGVGDEGGEWRWHSLNALAQRGDDGRVLRFLGTATDVHAWKAAEQLARESERRFRVIFEQAPLGIAVVHDDERWLETNDGLRRMLGYSAEELHARRWGDIVHPADRALHRAQMERLSRGLIDGYSVEKRYLRRDGVEVWVRLNAVRLGDELGSRRYLCVLEDVTARRRAEDAQRESEEVARQRTAELETIYATAPVGLALVDHRGFVVRANRAQLEGLGFRASLGLVGEPFLPQVPEVRGYIETVVGTGVPVLDVEVTLRDEGQAPRFLRCSFVGLRDASGRVDRVSCTLYDVTQHRRYEAALEEASRQKDHFLAVLGHELRNPLAAIATAAQLMKHLPLADPTMDRVSAIVERQAAHMTKLVDGLLDVSRIARGKILLERRRVDLVELVRASVEDRRALFHSRGLSLQEELPAAPAWIDADPTRIAQVIDNLLTNAMKFTDRGGAVVVTVSRGVDEVSLRVRDTGAGIAPELLGELFEPFRQADDTMERAAGGLGLGLALVRGLVELHGGRVSAHSDGPGRGAELHVVLPYAGPPSREVAGGEGEPGLRVLLVDGERDPAEALRRALAQAGHEVRVVHDARAALAVGQGFSPQVIVSELELPGMSGYDLARAVRADQHLQGARLIAVTALARASDRDEAFAAGFDAHLAKPFDVGALAALLYATPTGGPRNPVRPTRREPTL